MCHPDPENSHTRDGVPSQSQLEPDSPLASGSQAHIANEDLRKPLKQSRWQTETSDDCQLDPEGNWNRNLQHRRSLQTVP
jgi:hypothetical protein